MNIKGNSKVKKQKSAKKQTTLIPDVDKVLNQAKYVGPTPHCKDDM